GYVNQTYVVDNIKRNIQYLTFLAKGYTHLDAVKYTNKEYKNPSDGQFFNEKEADGKPIECKPKRFFSIENKVEYTKYSPEAAMVYFLVKGWTNLKHDEIKNFKIWYKDEPFEHPDETCKVHEFEVKPGNVFTSKLLNDNLDYTDNGPNVMVFNLLEGDNGIRTYYTLGFEYNDEIYHGDVGELMCIAKGVTEGDWIDMGLPSGTFWSSSNYNGASGTGYNTLKELASLGNLPSKAQFEELFSDENTYKVPLNKQWIRLVSKHNGNRIDFLFNGPFIRYVMDGTKIISTDKDEYIVYKTFWCNGFPTENHIMNYNDGKFGFIDEPQIYYRNITDFSHCARLVK
ncbi:MAG: hypothetical protein K2N25_02665, partial [Muribaculaceae bacterium]|nr:hypothetical protein [Muribaculaceae bacterium]